mmetsp:Transcript_17328/g.66036  ORF Transcript_17328/g.66036 Transcript_17328/m.66036 type:complete len:162 (-) Transcript_17328:19-504(-)
MPSNELPPVDVFDYIDSPPKGQKHGLRIPKLRLPLANEHEIKIFITNKNAWLGIPIGVRERVRKVKRLGPAERIHPSSRRWYPEKFRSRSADDVIDLDAQLIVTYTWLPVRLLSDDLCLELLRYMHAWDATKQQPKEDLRQQSVDSEFFFDVERDLLHGCH